jgi:CO/xanthine dehydrogenase Mo-binding subunit
VGFACAEDSGTCVAQIAEVEVVRTSGEVRLRRVLTVCEPGLLVNPDGLRSQIEGAVIMGLGLALREAVRYEQGRILNARFASYPIPAFPDLPQLETILITNPDQPPGGGGTPAIFPIAAAVSNAVFDAVGKRIPDLPLSPDRVLAALRQEV